MSKYLILIIAALLLVTPAYADSIPVFISGNASYDGNSDTDITITSIWTDKKERSASVRALNEKEAKKFGDAEKSGHYSFSQDLIQAKPGSMLTLKAVIGNESHNQSTIAFTANIVIGEDEGKTEFFGGLFEYFSSIVDFEGTKKNAEPTDYNIQELSPEENISREANETLMEEEESSRKRWAYLLAFPAIMLLIMLIALFRPIKDYSKEVIYSLFVPRKEIVERKASRFLNKACQCLSPEDNAVDAIDLFLKTNQSVIPITAGKKVVGAITKEGLLSKLPAYDFDSMKDAKLKYYMDEKFLSCGKNDSMQHIYKLMTEKDADYLIVKSGSSFLGVVGIIDILRAFESSFLIEELTVSQVMDEDVPTATSDTPIIKVLKDNFLKEKKNYAVVLEAGKESGIVTLIDVVDALYNSMDIKKSSISQITSYNIVSVGPETRISKAVGIVLERGFNQLPIEINGKIQGMATIRKLMVAYYEAITKMNK
ncbi:MAG: CBS domain-containing protein [Candidatus Woesearchaeota archaeon]